MSTSNPSADPRVSAPHSSSISIASPTHPVLIGYLFWIFGIFGAHRFYFGKPLTGALWFFTLGLVGIGWIVDLFLIPAMAKDAEASFDAGPVDYTIAWLLLTFLGLFGAHRFYMNRIITGALYLFTGGVFGLGIIYDFVMLNEQVHQMNVRGERPLL